MREIRSKDNKIWKRCEQLTMRKYRDRSGLYLIEGENLLDEAIRNHVRIETVLVREDCQKALPPEAADKAFLLDARLFDKLAQTVTSQGILAVVAKAEVRKEDFIGLPGSNFIVLDRLQDPGNIGTILRTADAAGYRLAILMKGTADVYAPKVVRAATGSLFRMPVVSMASTEELVEFTRAAGKKLTATCLDAQRCYYDEDLTHDIALVIGNEGSGVAPALIESSELRIKIPMQGNIESLNAAVAAGVLMYEAMRGKR
mgnify:CR=1 FL=1